MKNYQKKGVLQKKHPELGTKMMLSGVSTALATGLVDLITDIGGIELTPITYIYAAALLLVGGGVAYSSYRFCNDGLSIIAGYLR